MESYYADIPETEKSHKFLEKIGKDCKVIFTGAGTSEYVGNVAYDYLKTHGDFSFESVATTDLVSSPYLHFEKDQKHFWFLLQGVEIPQNLLQL